MMNEKQIRILPHGVRTVYSVEYFKNNLDFETEKGAQIEILEQVLNANGGIDYE